MQHVIDVVSVLLSSLITNSLVKVVFFNLVFEHVS